MMSLDTLITLGILLGAAVYLFHKFFKSKKGGCCGCSSEGSCGVTENQTAETPCGLSNN